MWRYGEQWVWPGTFRLAILGWLGNFRVAQQQYAQRLVAPFSKGKVLCHLCSPLKYLWKVATLHNLFCCLMSCSLICGNTTVKLFAKFWMPGGESDISLFWSKFQHHPAMAGHPLFLTENWRSKAIPISIHGDAVPTAGKGKAWTKMLLVLSWVFMFDIRKHQGSLQLALCCFLAFSWKKNKFFVELVTVGESYC